MYHAKLSSQRALLRRAFLYKRIVTLSIERLKTKIEKTSVYYTEVSNLYKKATVYIILIAPGGDFASYGHSTLVAMI